MIALVKAKEAHVMHGGILGDSKLQAKIWNEAVYHNYSTITNKKEYEN
jgi:hypothetical protein